MSPRVYIKMFLDVGGGGGGPSSLGTPEMQHILAHM